MCPNVGCDMAWLESVDATVNEIAVTRVVSYPSTAYDLSVQMYSTILVPIDGSDSAENALARALEFARTFDAAVHVLYVVDTGSEPAGIGRQQREELRHPAEAQGRRATAQATDRLTEHGLEATRAVLEGRPSETILAYAADHDVELVVMGTRSQSDRESIHLGSTTQRVIARADVPVLAVRSTEPAPAPESISYDRIVIPTDGSDAAERAAGCGLDLAETYGASVYVPYVIDTTMYDFEDTSRNLIGLLKTGGQHAVEEIAERARDRGLSVKTDVLRGRPDEELLEYAKGINGDLVVMGTRGRGGATGDVLGSTTARVLRRTTGPVLTVR
jgi:nucleotide-binding universal stress UspA family protein